jgi:oxygen-independent coproporphyrinogen-3 oxidase
VPTRADAHQIGFGVSSISFVAGKYFQNNKDILAYQKSMEEGRPYTYRGHLLTHDDEIRRALIMDLMCRLRVDVPRFEKQFGISFRDYFVEAMASLQEFVQDDLLDVSREAIEVKALGRLFIRNVAMCFDAYLEDIRRAAVNPVFSRTV